ncbi:hypothetical protein AGMMS49545_14310 [Betaproteobacteria bacterium]|nr:hypothetical protein AGMMS49545_14310 [Betaproteobacteria bacterium]GHU45813.1 hypothetical protein AGMMS50289_17780 [Betaproteobacteria bacterium]
MSLTITVKSEFVLDRLARLSQRMADLTPVMAGIGAALKTRISNRFETETDPDGNPWAGWSPATIKTYPEDGNLTILDRHGKMLDSLTVETTATSVTVGFAEPYATYHEYGTKKMPRRGLLFSDPETGTLSPDDERTVLDILNHFLSKTLP